MSGRSSIWDSLSEEPSAADGGGSPSWLSGPKLPDDVRSMLDDPKRPRPRTHEEAASIVSVIIDASGLSKELREVGAEARRLADEAHARWPGRYVTDSDFDFTWDVGRHAAASRNADAARRWYERLGDADRALVDRRIEAQAEQKRLSEAYGRVGTEVERIIAAEVPASASAAHAGWYAEHLSEDGTGATIEEVIASSGLSRSTVQKRLKAGEQAGAVRVGERRDRKGGSATKVYWIASPEDAPEGASSGGE